MAFIEHLANRIFELMHYRNIELDDYKLLYGELPKKLYCVSCNIEIFETDPQSDDWEPCCGVGCEEWICWSCLNNYSESYPIRIHTGYHRCIGECEEIVNDYCSYECEMSHKCEMSQRKK